MPRWSRPLSRPLGAGARPSPPIIPNAAQMSAESKGADGTASKAGQTTTASKPWRVDRYDKVLKWGERKIYRDPDTGLWWSKDTAAHGGSAWKVFVEERAGLR